MKNHSLVRQNILMSLNTKQCISTVISLCRLLLLMSNAIILSKYFFIFIDYTHLYIIIMNFKFFLISLYFCIGVRVFRLLNLDHSLVHPHSFDLICHFSSPFVEYLFIDFYFSCTQCILHTKLIQVIRQVAFG